MYTLGIIIFGYCVNIYLRLLCVVKIIVVSYKFVPICSFPFVVDIF